MPPRPTPRQGRVFRLLVQGAALYLLIGAVFAKLTDPEQLWACPDPTAPHAQTTGNFKRSDACRATVTTADRLRYYAFGSALWLPLIVGKGLADD